MTGDGIRIPGATARLGRSGVAVTGLGVGTAPLGNLYTAVPDAQARATVAAAWQAGIRYLDTAPHYGLGLAERRVGDALAALAGGRGPSGTGGGARGPAGAGPAGPAGRDAEPVVSSKVGRLLAPWPEGTEAPADDLADGFAVRATHRRVRDYSRDGVRRSVAESLRRLGRDRLDVAYVHDPDAHPEAALREALPALAELRAEGVVGAVGVGMNDAAALTRFVREAEVDVVLCAGRYTLLEQGALDDLLPACSARGTSVVVGGVFNSGLLARAAVPDGATYDYAAAPAGLLARARRLAEVCARHGVALPQAAVRFACGHPAVASVLVGVRSPEEVRAAVAAYTARVPAALWDELRAAGLLRADAPVPAGP